MHFRKVKGKQVLSLQDNFVLCRGDDLVTAVAPSAAPSRVQLARYVPGINKLGTWGKVRASCSALRFIWGSA